MATGGAASFSTANVGRAVELIPADACRNGTGQIETKARDRDAGPSLHA